jgi:trk system potassium uptake protein TrkH
VEWTKVSRHVHPNVFLIASFLLAILLGAMLLEAPFSNRNSPLSLLDAFFTATSAVCVTGLTVVDTGSRFTPTGQIILLCLIQLGGLGIMTYTTVVILILGRRLSYKGRELVHGTLSHKGGKGLYMLVRHVFIVTFLFEGFGLFLLYLRWRVYFPDGRAFSLALFHSVSAFCNAGFSLFSDSLIGFRGDLWINLIVMVLVVAGGTGFLVIQEIREYLAARLYHRKRFRLSLHSRTVLITTFALLLAGFVGYLGLEWSNTLEKAPLGEKLLVSLFQSVTPRTAGFNTVDYSVMTNGTLLFTILLMFIGASPGSAGGGVKTTSFAVLVALAYSKWKARVETVLFQRTVRAEIVGRSLAIILISSVIVLFFTMALMITELGDTPHAESRGLLMEYLFEAVSAFGTVGLSTGVTPSLSVPGKIVIMVLMFVGRLGPITIALAVAGKRKGKDFAYPEENLMVG